MRGDLATTVEAAQSPWQHHAAANGMAADALPPAGRAMASPSAIQAVAGGQHQPGGPAGVRPADRPVALIFLTNAKGSAPAPVNDRCEAAPQQTTIHRAVSMATIQKGWWNPAPPATPAQAAWAKGSVSRSVLWGRLRPLRSKPRNRRSKRRRIRSATRPTRGSSRFRARQSPLAPDG